VQFFNVAVLVLAGACGVSSEIRSAPASAVIQADAEVALEGTVEVLIEDSNQGSRTLYFLITLERRIPLRFSRAPVNLSTGARVRVRGRWEKENTLVVSVIERL
jgi:hypothetical protein